MNHYKIAYAINALNERVYPETMKGVVFALTQDHPTDHFMIAVTESELSADGAAVVLLADEEAELLIQQFRDSQPKPFLPGGPFPFQSGPSQ